MTTHSQSSPCGSILILVVWTLFFLASIGVAIHTQVSGLADAARRMDHRVKGYYLARGGVEVAAAMIRSIGSNAWHAAGQPWWHDEQRFHDVALGDGFYRVTHRGVVEPDKGTFFGMEDENGKLNLNTLPENSLGYRILKAFLEDQGELDSKRAGSLAAAVIDWKDASNVVFETDDTVRGAESDYYLRLSSPYRCHDAHFDTVEELLFVRDMTPDIYARIRPYITIFDRVTNPTNRSASEPINFQININTASKPVLLALGRGAQESDMLGAKAMADVIIGLRSRGYVFTNQTAITRELAPLLSPPAWRIVQQIRFLLGIRSTHFSGVSNGQLRSSPTPDRTIHFVLDSHGVIQDWEED